VEFRANGTKIHNVGIFIISISSAPPLPPILYSRVVTRLVDFSRFSDLPDRLTDTISLPNKRQFQLICREKYVYRYDDRFYSDFPRSKLDRFTNHGQTNNANERSSGRVACRGFRD